MAYLEYDGRTNVQHTYGQSDRTDIKSDRRNSCEYEHRYTESDRTDVHMNTHTHRVTGQTYEYTNTQCTE